MTRRQCVAPLSDKCWASGPCQIQTDSQTLLRASELISRWLVWPPTTITDDSGCPPDSWLVTPVTRGGWRSMTRKEVTRQAAGEETILVEKIFTQKPTMLTWVQNSSVPSVDQQVVLVPGKFAVAILIIPLVDRLNLCEITSQKYLFVQTFSYQPGPLLSYRLLDWIPPSSNIHLHL